MIEFSQNWSLCHWELVIEKLVANGDAHASGRSRNDLHRGLHIVGIEVWHLFLGDLPELSPWQNADFVFVRDLAARFEIDGLLDQLGSRGRLGDEGETAVLVHRDHDRDDGVAQLAGPLVELSAEILDVHAMLAQGWTDWRGRIGATGWNLQFDDLFDDFSHESKG